MRGALWKLIVVATTPFRAIKIICYVMVIVVVVISIYGS